MELAGSLALQVGSYCVCSDIWEAIFSDLRSSQPVSEGEGSRNLPQKHRERRRKMNCDFLNFHNAIKEAVTDGYFVL